VFSREELETIAALCTRFDAVAVTDEIYEHLVYRGEHVPIATLEGMRERTVTINGVSKTYSVTGWRLAYAIAPAEMTNAIRKVHDFVTVGAPHPLQQGVATALAFGQDYYDALLARYTKNRGELVRMLRAAGFAPVVPEGAYYVMADFSDVRTPKEAKADDRAFAEWLTKDVGLTGVPGGSFFHDPALGKHLIRFHFAAREEKLKAAEGKLAKLA
jgi:aminotransferase